jgi:hypothetical protein
MYKRTGLVIATMVLTGLMSAPALAASTSAAQRLPLFTGELTCFGEPATERPPTVGFAVIQPDPKGGTVAAEVALKRAAPNATYEVRLIETPGGENCHTKAGTIETNGHGNGSAHVEEPLEAGTTDAFVFVENEANSAEFFSTPDYVFGSK